MFSLQIYQIIEELYLILQNTYKTKLVNSLWCLFVLQYTTWKLDIIGIHRFKWIKVYRILRHGFHFGTGGGALGRVGKIIKVQKCKHIRFREFKVFSVRKPHNLFKTTQIKLLTLLTDNHFENPPIACDQTGYFQIPLIECFKILLKYWLHIIIAWWEDTNPTSLTRIQFP